MANVNISGHNVNIEITVDCQMLLKNFVLRPLEMTGFNLFSDRVDTAENDHVDHTVTDLSV